MRNLNGIPFNFITNGVNSVSGTTTETILCNVPIPANTFISGDVVYVQGLFETSTSNALNGVSLKMYINSVFGRWVFAL